MITTKPGPGRGHTQHAPRPQDPARLFASLSAPGGPTRLTAGERADVARYLHQSGLAQSSRAAAQFLSTALDRGEVDPAELC